MDSTTRETYKTRMVKQLLSLVIPCFRIISHAMCHGAHSILSTNLTHGLRCPPAPPVATSLPKEASNVRPTFECGDRHFIPPSRN